jgi:hypothetical protein
VGLNGHRLAQHGGLCAQPMRKQQRINQRI